MPKVLSEVLFHILILTKDHFFVQIQNQVMSEDFLKLMELFRLLLQSDDRSCCDCHSFRVPPPDISQILIMNIVIESDINTRRTGFRIFYDKANFRKTPILY